MNRDVAYVGHCAIQVHSIDGNTVTTLETDMEVEQEGNEVGHDLDEVEVQFNDSDKESDTDLDEDDSDSDSDLC